MHKNAYIITKEGQNTYLVAIFHVTATGSCCAGPYSLSTGPTPLKMHQRHLGKWRLEPTPLEDRRSGSNATPSSGVGRLRQELVAGQTPNDAFRQKT